MSKLVKLSSVQLPRFYLFFSLCNSHHFVPCGISDGPWKGARFLSALSFAGSAIKVNRVTGSTATVPLGGSAHVCLTDADGLVGLLQMPGVAAVLLSLGLRAN